MSRRLAASLAIVAALSGCATLDPGTSLAPPAPPSDSSPAPSTSTPTRSPVPTPTSTQAVPSNQPSPTNAQAEATYTDGDIVAVTGDGLAVRKGPSTQYALLGAERWGEEESKLLGAPYRLSSGEELIIVEGPLAIDGRDWYRVLHSDDEIQWVDPAEPGYGIYGWIAANDGRTSFVRLVEATTSECCFTAHGVGPGTTLEVHLPPTECPQGCSPGFGLTVGHPNPDGSCDVRVTDQKGAVLLDQTIIGWGNPGEWWFGYTEGDRLQIETDCAWYLDAGRYAA